MVGFHCDEEGDWVAHLDCGHRQHVRHRPPFQNRPWVLDEAGRAARLGALLECPLCDRGEPRVDGGAVLAGAVPAGAGVLESGGEAACYAHLLCPDCGVVVEPTARHRDGCPQAAGDRNG